MRNVLWILAAALITLGPAVVARRHHGSSLESANAPDSVGQEPQPAVRSARGFGVNTLALKGASELCIPAFKDAIPPTTTTALGPCNGGPFSCGGTCPPGGMCAPLGDFPPYFGACPTTCGGGNGGSCPPGEVCYVASGVCGCDAP